MKETSRGISLFGFYHVISLSLCCWPALISAILLEAGAFLQLNKIFVISTRGETGRDTESDSVLSLFYRSFYWIAITIHETVTDVIKDIITIRREKNNKRKEFDYWFILLRQNEDKNRPCLAGHWI